MDIEDTVFGQGSNRKSPEYKAEVYSQPRINCNNNNNNNNNGSGIYSPRLSPWRTGINTRPDSLGYVVDRLAVGQVLF
jgi:hypothetical protein